MSPSLQSDNEPIIVGVDDQAEVRRLLEDIFQAQGKRFVGFDVPDEAIAFIGRNVDDIELVVLDYDLGAGQKTGLDICRALHSDYNELPIIMLTGNNDVDTAIATVKAGASDFIVKDPYLEDKLQLSVDKIDRIVTHVRERRRLEGENRELRATNRRLLESVGEKWQIVGESNALANAMRIVEKVAKVPRPVLVLGERGTGKELVARAIHNLSPRASEPFVTINCAAVPETLLESELFGHEEGAFTGATKQKPGKFELADGGTLFLDEIGNMPLDFQAKILRILEYQRFQRVAGSESLQVDVRVIAATNADLQVAMSAGRFRPDLYDRLTFEVIELPPLRARKEDIPLLSTHFLTRFREEVVGVSARQFSDEATARLAAYDFPGNVREFKNIAERAIYYATGEEVMARDVEEALPKSQGAIAKTAFADDPSLPLVRRVDAFERQLCGEALRKARYNQKEAAAALGLTYDQFRQRYRKYGLGEDKE